MKTTCGVYIISDDKILLCHPTNAPSNVWSIPKGLNEEGEDYAVTASRELEEETGIKINPKYLLYVGERKYPYREKILKGFIAIKAYFNLDELKCTSFFENKRADNIIQPEVDEFTLMPIPEALKVLNHPAASLLQEIIYLLSKVKNG